MERGGNRDIGMQRNSYLLINSMSGYRSYFERSQLSLTLVLLRCSHTQMRLSSIALVYNLHMLILLLLACKHQRSRCHELCSQTSCLSHVHSTTLQGICERHMLAVQNSLIDTWHPPGWVVPFNIEVDRGRMLNVGLKKGASS